MVQHHYYKFNINIGHNDTIKYSSILINYDKEIICSNQLVEMYRHTNAGILNTQGYLYWK